MSEFMQAISNRRSIYSLGSTIDITPEVITSRIETILDVMPSPFNMQSARVVVLFGKYHEQLWDIVKDILKARLTPDRYAKTEQKINTAFYPAAGSLMYFDDNDRIKQWQDQYPSYADRFPGWSLQANAMVQFSIWTELEDLGLGASVQHYNPLIDDQVHATFDIPASWTLISQMPFGKKLKDAPPREGVPAKDRMKVFLP